MEPHGQAVPARQSGFSTQAWYLHSIPAYANLLAEQVFWQAGASAGVSAHQATSAVALICIHPRGTP